MVKFLLNNGIEIHYDYAKMLVSAITSGSVEMLEQVLELYDHMEVDLETMEDVMKNLCGGVMPKDQVTVYKKLFTRFNDVDKRKVIDMIISSYKTSILDDLLNEGYKLTFVQIASAVSTIKESVVMKAIEQYPYSKKEGRKLFEIAVENEKTEIMKQLRQFVNSKDLYGYLVDPMLNGNVKIFQVLWDFVSSSKNSRGNLFGLIEEHIDEIDPEKLVEFIRIVKMSSKQ